MRPLALLAVLCCLPAPAFATSRTGVLVPEVAERYDASLDRIVPAGPTTFALHKGRRRVRVAPDRRYVTGAKLKVRGTLDGAGVLVPELTDRGVKLLKLPPQTPTLPVERLLVLPLAHPGSPATRTRESLLGAFAHLADAVASSSYGRTTITVTVLDWQTVPLATDCTYAGLLQQAFLAHDAAVDFRAFSLVVVVEADGVTCADGSGGAGGGAGRVTIATPDGPAYLGTAITGAAWAASLHEVGHAMGLSHANSLDCPTPGLPLDFGGCVNMEYGDPFDIMGQAVGDFHVLHKRQLGWVRTIGPELLQTVTEAGTYQVEPLEVPSLGVGPKGLLLPLATTPITWLTVEARRPSGLDHLYPDDWFDGVLLHASVSGVLLPNWQGEMQPQGPLASHLLWPSLTQGPADARVATGGSLIVWPWMIQVLARDPVTKVVTVHLIYLPDCCFTNAQGYQECRCV